MKHYIQKNPAPRVVCQRQFVEDSKSLPPPWELMPAEDFPAWLAQQPKPEPEPVRPHRVSKDTLISRIAAKGDAKVEALDDLIQAQPKVRRVLWRDFSWFWSNNQSVRQLIAAIGLDADEMLAPDEWLN